ncbi:MAG: DUF1579 domain-containing protein [Fimbriimonadaceae bacterium]|nr:DUF1579 domain-containing protein [Fimbriimonadaceae bacterium]
MFATPQKEHEWLQKFVGEWTFEMPGCGEGQEKSTGTETGHMIGGLWAQLNGSGEMPDGSPMTTRMTVGFDPQKGRYIGTWIGSMMTHLWVYDGEMNEAGTTLTLSAEGPDFETPGKMRQYRDVMEFKSDDHRVLTSHMLGDNGEWTQFMEANYYRVK